MNDIGERLRHVQKSKGCTQKEFADIVGIGFSSIKNYMAGTRILGTDVLQRICEKLLVSPDWLVLGKGEMYFAAESGSGLSLDEKHEVFGIVRSLSPKRKATVMRLLSRVEEFQDNDATEAASEAFTQNKIDAEEFTTGLQEIEELEQDILVVAAIECKIEFLTEYRKPARLEVPIFNEMTRKRIIAAIDSIEEGRSCVEQMLDELEDKWRELTEAKKMKDFRTMFEGLPDQNKTGQD